jgi:hypothetical protein
MIIERFLSIRNNENTKINVSETEKPAIAFVGGSFNLPFYNLPDFQPIVNFYDFH